MDAARFQAMCDYVGFDAQTQANLRKLLPIAQPHLAPLVDDFYRAIARDSAVSKLITGGEPQVVHRKTTLLEWLHSAFTGPYDEAYLQSRQRIGRAHVHVELPQEYVMAAVNRIRNGLIEVVFSELPQHETAKAVTSINRAFDLEVALMLDAYRQDSLARVHSSARLAAIGQLAASIGHELRNPLSVMESSIYLLTQRLSKTGHVDDVLDKHLKRVHFQIGQCANTISSLLDMARDAPLQRQQFALSDFVHLCLKQIYIPENVLLNVDVDPGLVAFADKEQLTRVMINLLRNGVEAIGGPGIIQVGGRTARSGVEWWVEDSGPGVPEDHRSRIFDVLFTTRSKGTGLGLALCRRIVLRHGGELTLDSTPGKGAKFRVWLPDKAHAPDEVGHPL